MKLFSRRRIRPFTKSEKGSVALFGAVILIPLMFFLFGISFDVAAYFRQSQMYQKILDDAALHAYRFLPYTDQAQYAAQSYLTPYTDLSTHTSVKVSTRFVSGSSSIDSVSLSYSFTPDLIFARLFGVQNLYMYVYSKARGTPFDTFIAVDTSGYLAPDELTGTPWDDAVSWPAAKLFAGGLPGTQLSIRGPTGAVLDPRVVTQQCYNSAFLPLKSAAITMYDYLSAFKLNTVGLEFYPLDPFGTEMSRDVVVGGTRTSPPGVQGEADFGRYSSLYMSDAVCAAASEREIDGSQYFFPATNESIEGPPLLNTGAPLTRVPNGNSSDVATWLLDPAYKPFLRAREVIWSKSVQTGKTHDIGALFDELEARLIGAAPILKNDGTDARGGLAPSIVKTGIIFAGDVPWRGGVRYPGTSNEVRDVVSQKLARLQTDVTTYGLNVKLYYVVFPHNGNSTDLDSRVTDLKGLFDSSRGVPSGAVGSFDVRLIYANDPVTLSQNLIGSLVLDKRTSVVSE